MECRAVINSLSDFLDGQNVWISDGEVKQIEAHLTTCPACQNLKLELREIKTAARELPLHTPPRALWTRISNELEREIAAENSHGYPSQSNSGWWERVKSRKFTFSLPQLVGAGALVLALIIAAISGIFSPHSGALKLSGVQSALLPEEIEIKAELERRMDAVNGRKVNWDLQRRAEFEEHLTRIDESLKRCRQTLEDNPKDAVQQQMVRALYIEKRQLLEDVERLRW